MIDINTGLNISRVLFYNKAISKGRDEPPAESGMV